MRPIKVSLPHPSSDPRHPLPLGMLVPTTSEPALLVIMPISGKVTYWESLSNAASADLSRRKQQSVQGVVPGLMSGETVTKITEAEPRGFVLTMSTGRLAHLIVNDPQGKSCINIQFMRDSGASSGGVFGSLRSVFSSSSWKKDVAAVRAGNAPQRGLRYVVIATTKATFQIWELSWNGTHALIDVLDAKSDTLHALKEAGVVFDDDEEHLFEFLDFTILAGSRTGKEISKCNQNGNCKIMALVVLRGTETSRYSLVGMTLENGSINVDVVHPIVCYKSSIPAKTDFKPQVLVPETSQTAFIIFEKTLVLVSLAEIDETPSSQLQMEANTLPKPFQDAIDFRGNKPYRVTGCSSEPCDRSHTQSSCVVMVYGFGVIRISALPLKEGQSTLERERVTAKTKIEQAVFFGSLQQVLFDFAPRPETEFSSADIESAAFSISHSIMSSTSAYIPAIGPSMDIQLQRRSAALNDLNKYLRKCYPNVLSRLAKWELLWHAEKMAAAQAIWRCYESALRNEYRDSDERSFLTDLIETMGEGVKVENQPERYETDGVRHWFIHDIWRIEYIIAWAENIIELWAQEDKEDFKELAPLTQARLVSEANDVQLAGLETAFRFREANIAAYGLETENLSDGVLQCGYDDLPEFWTSSINIFGRVKHLTDISRDITKSDEEEGAGGEQPPDALIFKLAADNPRQVQICCQAYTERFQWLKSRPEPVIRAAGEQLMRDYLSIRTDLFTRLSEIGLPDMGIKLAEKYRDMEALIDIIDQDLESEDSDKTAEWYIDLILSYFTRFGTTWANAYFKKYLDGGRAVSLLNNNAGISKHLTIFLRSHPAYARLSWINEVTEETDYLAASSNLMTAQKQETNLWGKRIELSMSKLNLMTATLKGQVDDKVAKPMVQKVDEKMAAFDVQEKLCHHIKPTVKNALDEDAEIELAMQRYGSQSTEGKPILSSMLKNQLRKILDMEALSLEGLIDALTLLYDERVLASDKSVMDLRFFSALKLLDIYNLAFTDPGHKQLLEKSIWRRCMIQDNWEDINRTDLKDDTQVEAETGATSLFMTLKEGFRANFWDKHSPLPPLEVIEAGTTIDSLKISSYFAKMPDNALQSLSRDFGAEAELLDQYMEKGRLEEWWKGVVDAARASARADADAEGEEKLKRRNEEREFDVRLTKMDQKVFGKDKVQDVQVDDQGDVVMA